MPSADGPITATCSITWRRACSARYMWIGRAARGLARLGRAAMGSATNGPDALHWLPMEESRDLARWNLRGESLRRAPGPVEGPRPGLPNAPKPGRRPKPHPDLTANHGPRSRATRPPAADHGRHDLQRNGVDDADGRHASFRQSD